MFGGDVALVTGHLIARMFDQRVRQLLDRLLRPRPGEHVVQLRLLAVSYVLHARATCLQCAVSIW